MNIRDIDPGDLAERAHEAAVHRAHRLAFATGHELRAAGISDIRHAVRILAIYATTGAPPEGRVELTHAHEYMLSVAEALDIDDALDEELRLVCSVAEAREHIARGLPITTMQLAQLAGISHQRVTKLRQRGDAPEGIEVSDAQGKPRMIPADEARAWLIARGVSLPSPNERT